MNRVQLLRKQILVKNLICSSIAREAQKVNFRHKSSTSSSSSSSSSDDEAKAKSKLASKEQEKSKSKEALDKLNKLLLQMASDDTPPSQPKLDLARPLNRRKTNKEKVEKVQTHEEKIANAAEEVAKSIGGDVKKTQSELLLKLLNPSTATEISDLVKGMKIDHTIDQTKADQVRKLTQSPPEPGVKTLQPRAKKARPSDGPAVKIDLFGSEPLGIFTNDQTDASEGVENFIWNQLYEKDLQLAVTHPPSNHFQQMIQWTEQGKVWKFPIDNEQDLAEESKVSFAEHLFLEKHLEPWCPAKGPMRHFMELVCTGLSKNPYLTAEAKREHILWFKGYFEEKKQLLIETGVIQEGGSVRDSQNL